MPVRAGSRLGPYEILSAIGAGGMGEVYRARDERLNRTIAVKVLASALSSNPEYRQRFEREARTVAALSHPHICPVYDIGAQDGLDYLVMEYLEGETLAARVAKGRLPIDETLRYAIQIADALCQAHRHGVIHRDLKPGNIMLTKAGAKLLDFGLAKVNDGCGDAPGSLTSAPTETTPLTRQGSIAGTLQYMAPEQLEGQEADARSDIFALGLILYEMLSGKRAFEARSQAGVISAIMTAEVPPLSSLNSAIPPALDHVVTTCVAKDPDARWQATSDVLLQLKWIAGAGSRISAPIAARGQRRNLALLTALAVSVIAVIVLAWMHFGERAASAQSQHLVRFAIHAPVDAGFLAGADIPVLSPDGQRLVFTGSRRDGVRFMWYQPLDTLEAKAIPGTESAALPFWSPDSQSVAFYSEVDKKLKRVDLNGAAVLPLCALGNGIGGGAWLPDGSIIFSDNAGLKRVSSTGGDTKPVFRDVPAPKMVNLWPKAIPDRKHILFLAVGADSSKEGIYAGDLVSGKAHMVMPVRSLFEFSPAGYILYNRQQAIMAQPFDARALAIKGSPTTVVDRAGEFSSNWGALASTSANGTLAYSRPVNRAARLHWYSRGGTKLSSIEGARFYYQLLISPDGRRAAVELTATEKVPTPTIWLLELSTGILSLFTPNADFRYSDAVWSADSRDLYYQRSSKDGKSSIVRQPAGGGAQQVIISPEAPLYPEESLPDGSLLAISRSGKDLVRISASGGKRETIFHTDFESDEPHVSPDGRWIAYACNESGQWEIYVAAFPSFSNRKQASAAGGMAPVWRTDGKELFYLTPVGKLMSVGFKGGAQPETSTPAELFQTRLRADPRYNQYTVSSDGQRFLLYEPVEENDQPFYVIMNWTSLLKR